MCDRARRARDSRFDGRFFIAVLTTGIYCRPICPSPTARRENVRFYGSVGEAVAAGFRPCLRCRPETAPGTAAWTGTLATVTRALRLIAQGTVQRQGVAGLSQRLGVSARHLHRLFRLHLGTSPLAVAKTWRLNFARELIAGTDLPMSRVALRSGFRTVRRFNDSIRRLYGRPPTALRRLPPLEWPARQDAYVLRLPYRPPFDWDSLLAFLAARAIPGVEEVVSGAYRRCFSQDGRHGILEVRNDRGLQVLEVHVRSAEPASLLPIATRLRSLFDLGADTVTIAEHLGSDPLLKPLVKRYPGLRVPGAWDGFELAVRAILGQQVSVAAASTLAGRLARRFGEPLSVPDTGGRGGLAVTFPSARDLAVALLTGLPRMRAEAITSLARACLSGQVTLAGSDEAAVANLKRVRGIGEWTAQYIALRALGHPDAFPASDLILLRAARRGGRLTETALLERAEGWRPWRAYAAIYLWRSAALLTADVPRVVARSAARARRPPPARLARAGHFPLRAPEALVGHL